MAALQNKKQVVDMKLKLMTGHAWTQNFKYFTLHIILAVTEFMKKTEWMRQNFERDKSVTLTFGLLDTAISARALIGLHFSTAEGAAAAAGALNMKTE